MIDKNIQVKRGEQVKASPSVSIIMPAYNVVKYIAEALDSILAQTFANYEIIVINDGSPDTPELEEVLEAYRDRIVYAKHENRGLSGARNTGLRLARAPFVALLDSDDVWMPNYLEVQMEMMKRDSTIDVLYPNAVIFGGSLDDGRKMMDLSPSNGEVTFEQLVSLRCSVVISVIARREIMFRVGLFDENLRSCEDFDMWLRIVKCGGRIAYHRQVLFCYRRRRDSLSSDPIWMYKHSLQVLEKAEQTLNLTPSERETLSQSKVQFQANLLLYKGKNAFFEGDTKTAVECLTEANIYFKSLKIGLLVKFLPIAPKFISRLYNARDRFVFKANTKFEIKP